MISSWTHKNVGWIKMFSCRPILFYVLYVTFIHDKLFSNAVYIVSNTVARPTSLRIGKNLS